MRKITFILFFLFFGFCFGQHPSDEICSLQPKNKAWIHQFKKADDLDAQIDLIINKIILDTDYIGENTVMASLSDNSVFNKVPCSSVCSIRFGLIYAKNKGIILDLKKNPELEDLIFEFTSENINRIELNEYQEKDIYNPSALKRSGVVLYTDDKELRKKVRRAIKKGMDNKS